MITGALRKALVTRRLGSHRQVVALCRQNATNISAQTATNTNVLTADFLLSEEHKQHFLACMQNTPPVGKRDTQTSKAKAYAAVLIALCTPKYTENEEKSVSILYTRRSIHLTRHVRQVSFPGGLQDHTDCDYIDCALRETEEEIGLPRSRVEIWGTGKIITPPHTAAIMPVFGVIRDLDLTELMLNIYEVEDAFTVDIKDLISPDNFRHTQFKSGFSSPLFSVKPYRIWGITAFLTNSFLQCLLPKGIYRNRVKFVRPFKTEKPRFHKTNE